MVPRACKSSTIIIIDSLILDLFVGQGYYRKGCALVGLNKKTEAAVAFLHCLARDPGNKGVKKSLAKVGRFFYLEYLQYTVKCQVFFQKICMLPSPPPSQSLPLRIFSTPLEIPLQSDLFHKPMCLVCSSGETHSIDNQ